MAGAGGAGVLLGGAGAISIGAAGSIAGGAGGVGGAGEVKVYGGAGGAGGAGAALTATGETLTSAGSIRGGNGGIGGKGNQAAGGGVGGAGGAGVSLVAGDSVGNSGVITGGAGGKGGQYYSHKFQGGSGGAGVAGGGIVTNTGTIAAGVGGAGGDVPGVYTGGPGGAGGIGVAASVVNNAGLISGGVGGAGGSSTEFGGNGGFGGAGVQLAAGGTAWNTGIIKGGVGGLGSPGSGRNGANGASGAGVALLGAGAVTNGSSLSHTAQISGGLGVATAGGYAVTVVNYATITGTGGAAVSFLSANDRLVVGGGADFVGGALGGGGTLELSATTGTIAGLGASATLSGAEAGSFSGFAAYIIDGGAAWTLAGANALSTSQALTNDGSLIVAQSLANLGSITSPAGNAVALAAGGQIANGSAAVSTALIQGAVGVYGGAGAAGTVTNFALINGASGDGVELLAGGVVVNGSGAATSAVIQGSYFALEVGNFTAGAAASVANYGTIDGGVGGFVDRSSGGLLTNGAAGDTSALVEGATGVFGSSLGGLSVANFGTIEGIGGQGVWLAGTGTLTNGASGSGAGLIEGTDGVYAAVSGASVTNHGLIKGLGISNATAAVVLSAGGSFTNAAGALAQGYNGARLGAGASVTNSGTISALDSAGVYVTAATAWVANQAGGTIVGAHYGVFADVAATVTNAGLIEGGIQSVHFGAASDRLIVDAGAKFEGVAAGGGGTLELAAGKGRINGVGRNFIGFGAYAIDAGGTWTVSGKNTQTAILSNAGTLTLADTASLTIQGAIANSGAIKLAGATAVTSLIVAKVGATLSGHGSVVLGANAFNTITGASSAATLTNVDNTISGGGVIGAGKLVLVNQAAGVIKQTGSVALTIDTGTNSIVNAGTIEASGTGGLTIAGAVANTGVLEAIGGELTLDGAVTKTGAAVINAGTLYAASTFAEAVSFKATAGELILANSQTYTGKITGFSTTGGTSLDLRDIGFVSSSEATFSGTKAGGVLTVTDGTHTAKITLVGDYTASTFTAAGDSHGGVVIVDPAPRQARAFVQAMARVAANAGPAAASIPATSTQSPTPVLVEPAH